mmetsp:Transcript_87450/g.187612  ORF Transcript_87450/g.187612 Transcript_87450/m.187612 type:complete len:1260 (+) Transcript_87450:95-3874(+)
MPSFAALPALEDSVLQTETILRPAYNVLSVAELTGSPYLLSGDGKGFISAWNVGPKRTSQTEPDHYFEAHRGEVNQIVLLKRNLLPEAIEENEWPEPEEGPKLPEGLKKRKALEDPVQKRLIEDAAVAQQARQEELDFGPPPEGVVPRKAKAPPKRGLLASFCPCLAGNGKPRLRNRKKKQTRHWLVATTAQDGALRVWRWRYAMPPRGQQQPGGPVLEVDFIIEWAEESGKPVTNCIELYDGLLAVSVQGSADVRLLDPSTAQVKWMLFGHTGPVSAITQCPDGRVVSGGQDGAVRLWAQRTWRPGQDQQDRPPTPTLVWGEPGAECTSAGVSSVAKFGHMHQEPKAECIAMMLRVCVDRAYDLPKGDIVGLSDPYVTIKLIDGDPKRETSVKTPSKRGARWDHTLTLSLRRVRVDGKLQFAECSTLEFEICTEWRDVVVAHWTASVDDILAEIAETGSRAAVPKAQKLYSPLGEGPYEDLATAVMYVGFEQRTEDTISCIIQNAEDLPSLGGRSYVRMSITQSTEEFQSHAAGAPSKVLAATQVIENTLDPIWNEVLDLEVPVYLSDREIVHSADMHLVFEVYDHDVLTADDILASLTLPLSEALQDLGGEPRPYNLEYMGGKVVRNKNKGRKGLLEGDADGKPQGSRLHLAFQAISPCPLQLKCVIEHARALPISKDALGSAAPAVRMRFVEGNPILPQITSVRTRTCQQTLKPVWREKCFLPVPWWLREPPKSPDEGRKRRAVRAEWQHERPGDRADSEAVVCIDIWDADIFGDPDYLCRATVPFAKAQAIARLKDGATPKPITLSNAPDAFIWLGFEMNGNTDELVVIVEKAENIPAGDITGRSDPFCIVRIAELGAFGAPTDKAQLKCMPVNDTPPAAANARDPVWRHEELIDLPGGMINGFVAALPNWYVLLEIIDKGDKSGKEIPLAQAAVPLSEVLDQLQQMEEPEPTAEAIKARLESFKSPVVRAAMVPPPRNDGHGTGPVVHELKLTVPERVTKKAVPMADNRSYSGAGELVLVPNAAQTGGAKGAQEDEPQEKKKRRRSTFLSSAGKAVSSSLANALNALGIGDGTAPPQVEPGQEDEPRLVVIRFEGVCRWKNSAVRKLKSPPVAAMSGPTPVTCIVTLGSSVVAAHENGNIFVWDSTGCMLPPLHQFQAHRVCITGMTSVPPLGCIITAATGASREESVSDSGLRVWNVSTLELHQSFSLHSAATRCVKTLSTAGQPGAPCIAIGTDTRQSRLLQLLKLAPTSGP